MRIVIQKVKQASVTVAHREVGRIDHGLLILIGVEDADNEEDAEWLAKKACNMRLFADDEGVNNRSVTDVDGGVLVVSQFTLHAGTKKGNRPSYIRAAKPDHANELYQYFVKQVSQHINKPVPTGEFGEMMDVALVNDGPMTILMDSKNKE